MMTDGANENRKEKSFSNDKMNDIYSEISKLNTTRSIRMSFRPEEKKLTHLYLLSLIRNLTL